jgi:hypothetical protein
VPLPIDVPWSAAAGPGRADHLVADPSVARLIEALVETQDLAVALMAASHAVPTDTGRAKRIFAGVSFSESQGSETVAPPPMAGFPLQASRSSGQMMHCG